MGKQPNIEVSIVTIVFNGEREVEQTIKSVVLQNYSPVEYIIIDGNSTDNTINIVNKYKSKIDTIVSEPDDGIYDAINKGITLCKGDLIGLIHAGDSYAPGAIKNVVDAFIETNADVIYGNMFSREITNVGTITKHHVADHSKLKNNMSIFHPSTFIKRQCYLNHGLYNTKYILAADYDYLLKLFLLGKHYYHINKPIANFLQGGLSGSNFPLSVKDNFNIRRQNLNYLYAMKYFMYQIVKHYYYYWRFKLITSIIGINNYNNLKIKKYKKND